MANSAKYTKTNKSRLSLLALEPRLVFDGAGTFTPAELCDTACLPESGELDAQSGLASAHPAAEKILTPEPISLIAPLLSRASAARTELVVVDGALANLQTLLTDIRAADPSRTVLVLQPGADEVAELTTYLQKHSDTFDAIHLLSHGSAGSIRLADQTLDLATPSTNAALWNSVRTSLTDNGDLLLYGCSVSAGDASQEAITRLAQFTAADIAASTDITGAGGNWVLEHHTGAVEASALNAPDYQSDLWVIPTSVTVPAPFTVVAPPGPTSGNQYYVLDPAYGLMQGSWWGQDAGGKASLTTRATYNNKANAQANLTPLDLTLGNNTGGPGIRFTMVETNDGSVQTSVDVSATSYEEALANNEYFYSTMQVGANSAVALNNLRFTPVNSKTLVSSQDTSLAAANGGPLPAVNSPLVNTAAQMALVLYDTGTQTLTRLTPGALNVNASGGAVNTLLDKVGLTPGGSYELRFYVWSLGGSTSTVYVDNPVIFTVINEAPTANADAFDATGATPVVGNLITANNGSGVDTDPENQTLSIQQINGASYTIGSTISTAHGTLTITNANGAFTYTANTGYSGTDTFNYTIVDSYGVASTATATITVTIPVTVNDITVNEGSPYGVFTVGGSDGQTMTLGLANDTASGTGTDYGAASTVTTVGQSNLEYSLDGGTTWVRYTAPFVSTLTGSGASTGLLVRTPIKNDSVSDNGETFTLTATPSTGAAATGTATIYDNGTGQWFAGTSGTGSNSAPAGQFLDGDMPLTVDHLIVNEGTPYAVWTVTYGAGKQVNLSLRDGTASQAADMGRMGPASVADDLLTYGAGHQMETSADGGTTWTPYTAGSSVAIGNDSKLLVRVRVNNDVPYEVSEVLNLDVRGATTTGTPHEIAGTSTLAISAVAGAAALDASASANLIQNGDFSQYTGNYFWGPRIANPGNIAAWQESGGGPRTYASIANSEAYFGNQNGWGMYDGANAYPVIYDANLFDARGFTTGNFYFRDPGTDSAGRWVAGDYGDNNNPPALSQTLQTEVGANYRLQFTQKSEYPASLDGIAAVSVNGQRVYFRVDSDTDQIYTLQFTANSPNTTIQFMSWGHIWGRDELVLDNVIVNKVPLATGTLTILDTGQGAYYDGTSATPVASPPPLNDDRANTPLVNDVAVNEGSPYGVFSVNGMPGARVDLSATPGAASLSADLSNMAWSNDGGATWNTSLSGATLDANGALLVRFVPTNDTTYEVSETFTLTATYSATQAAGVVVTSGGADSGTGTILDNGTGQWFTTGTSAMGSNSAPTGAVFNDDRTISVNNIAVNEASGYAVFTVTATAGETVSMLSLNDGTANGKGVDYGSDVDQGGPPQYNLQYSVDGGLTWNTFTVDPYLRSASTFTVPTSVAYPAGTAGATFLVRTKLNNDSAFDNGETFTLTAALSGGQSSTGTGTIFDDGTGTIFTSTGAADTVTPKSDDRGANPVVNDVTVNEGSPFAVFTVEGKPGAQMQLDLVFASGAGRAASADLSVSTPVLEYFDGSTWRTYDPANKPVIPTNTGGKMLVRTAVVNDAASEGAETFTFTATYAAGTINTGLGVTANASDTGIGTLVDNGTGIRFVADDPTTLGVDESAPVAATVNGQPTLVAPTLTPPTGSQVLAADAPALGNDDRPVTVTGFTVNEASPYGIFKVNGAARQYVKLTLADGSAVGGSTSPSDGSVDYNSTLQYFDGTAWQTYVPGAYVQIPTSGSTLLVRTAIVNDAPYEGAQTLTLVAANTQGTASSAATGTIVDNGTGDLFSTTNTSGTPDAPGTNGAPATLNDDRVGSPYVNSVTVNEASPYIVFTVSGMPGAGLNLNLSNDVATGIGHAIVGADTAAASTLQVYYNGAWVGYTSSTAILDTNGQLLVRLAVTNDSVSPVFEGPETFNINATYNGLGTPTTAVTVGGSASGVGTIKDDGTGSVFIAGNNTGTPDVSGTGYPAALDNDKPTFSVNSVSTPEGSALVFTVSMINASVFTTTVDWATGDGTATLAGLDYSAGSGTLSFAAGTTSLTQTVSVSTLDNTVYEGSETLTLNLSNATAGATVATAHVTGTITDAADLPTVSITDVTVTEATAGYATVMVTLSGASELPISFTPTLANRVAGAIPASGTANADVATDTGNTLQYQLPGSSSWTPVSGPITLPAGTTSVQLRTAIVADAVGESTESFYIQTNTLTAGSGAGAASIPGATGTVSIIDYPTMSISSVKVNEASPYALVEVSLSQAASSAISFAPSLSSGTGTAAVDTGTTIEYLDASNQWQLASTFDGTQWTGGITLPQGTTGVLLRTSITHDAQNEMSEVVNISTGAATNVLNASGVSGTITIVDQGSTVASDVKMFSASATSTTPDLTPASGAVVNPAALPASQMLLDDDRPLSVDNVTVNENSPWIVFKVTGAVDQYVKLATVDSTAVAGTSSPTDGSVDYRPNLQYFDGTAWQNYTLGTFVKLPGGSTTLLVRTAIVQDVPYEGAQTFNLVATNTGGTSTPNTQGVGTIVDDGTGTVFVADNPSTPADESVPVNNAAPTLTPPTSAVVDPDTSPVPLPNDDRPLSVNNVTVNEASPFMLFTVSGGVDQYVRLSTADGTAMGGSTSPTDGSVDYRPNLQYFDGSVWVDYTPRSFAKIPGGGMTLLVRTAVVQDVSYEGAQTFNLVATNTGGTSTPLSQGLGTIRDDGQGDLFVAGNQNGTPDALGTPGAPAMLNDDRIAPPAPKAVGLGTDPSATADTETGPTLHSLEVQPSLHVQAAVADSRQLANRLDSLTSAGTLLAAAGHASEGQNELRRTQVLIDKFERVTDPDLHVQQAVASSRQQSHESQIPAHVLQTGLLRVISVLNESSSLGQRQGLLVADSASTLADQTLTALTQPQNESNPAPTVVLNEATLAEPLIASKQALHLAAAGEAQRAEAPLPSRGHFGFSKQLQMSARQGRV